MDVAQKPQGVGVGLYGDAFVSIHPEMPLFFFAAVIVAGIFPVDQEHRLMKRKYEGGFDK